MLRNNSAEVFDFLPNTSPEEISSDDFLNAVRLGDSVTIYDFLDNASPDILPDTYNKALQLAVLYNHLSIISTLLDDRRVNPGADNNCALLLAATSGFLGIVKRLLQDQRVDPAAWDNLAYFQALKRGHHEIVVLLLNHYRNRIRSDLNQKYRVGDFNLKHLFIGLTFANAKDLVMKALEKGYADIAVMLVRHLLNDSSLEFNNDHLVEIFKKGMFYRNTKIVGMLLADTRFKIRIDYFISAMQQACSHEYTDVLGILLKAADFRFKKGDLDASRYSLIYAAKNGKKDIASYLLTFPEIDPSAFNLALSSAVSSLHAEVIKLILNDPRTQPDKKTFLKIFEFYVCRDNITIIKLLLDNVNFRIEEHEYITGVKSVFLRGRKEVLEMLLNDSRLPNFSCEDIFVGFPSYSQDGNSIKLFLQSPKLNCTVQDIDKFIIDWIGHFFTLRQKYTFELKIVADDWSNRTTICFTADGKYKLFDKQYGVLNGQLDPKTIDLENGGLDNPFFKLKILQEIAKEFYCYAFPDIMRVADNVTKLCCHRFFQQFSPLLFFGKTINIQKSFDPEQHTNPGIKREYFPKV